MDRFQPIRRKFLTTDHDYKTTMSYAGPVSRGKRAPDANPSARTSTPSSISPRPRSANAPRSAPYDDETRAPLAFAAGIALGIAVGAGAALLLAPASGADTRHAIARKGRRLRRHGRDAWDDLRREFRHALARRKREALRRHTLSEEDDLD